MWSGNRLGVVPLAVAAVVVAASGCQDANAPAPGLVCPTAQVPLCANPGAAADAIAAVEDAAARLAPALSGDARTTLIGHLATLTARMRAGRITDARETLAASRDALRAVSDPGDAADADAITLALDASAFVLGAR